VDRGYPCRPVAKRCHPACLCSAADELPTGRPGLGRTVGPDRGRDGPCGLSTTRVVPYSVVRRMLWCRVWLRIPSSWASSSAGVNSTESASNWNPLCGETLKLRPVGRGPGHRGRRPRPWRSHAVRSRIVAETRRTRRARRGRPTKTDPPPTESGYRVGGEGEVLRNPEANHGWTVRATTVCPAEATDTEMRQAYHDHKTTVEPGCRGIQTPAAIAPG